MFVSFDLSFYTAHVTKRLGSMVNKLRSRSGLGHRRAEIHVLD